MRIITIILMVILGVFSAHAGKQTLKVGVFAKPPFVLKEGNYYSGIAVDLWDKISKGINLEYEFVEYPSASVDDYFQYLRDGKIDVLVGPISITPESYEIVDFTLPYYIDEVHPVLLSNFFENAFFILKMFLYSAGGILLLFLFLFVFYLNLLWFFERKSSKVIPVNYIKGISYLFWTHVLKGQHDEIPKSIPGKLLILMERGTFIVIVVTLNAIVISFLTVSLVQYSRTIREVSDMGHDKVGALKGSKAYHVGERHGLNMVPFPSDYEGFKALEEKKIRYFLEDFATAKYYLHYYKFSSLSISEFQIQQDLYHFATRRGSPLTRAINQQMLEMRKAEVLVDICRIYLKQGEEKCDF